MTPAPDSRHGVLCLPIGGCLLVQPEVSAVFVVVADVRPHEPFQMPLVEHDHMVEKFSSAVANESFGHAILPRASDRNSNRGDAETLSAVSKTSP
jgi:hypothetical protein